MTRPTHGTPAGDAYLDLQNQARRSKRPTQELHQMYVLEGFLARLAASSERDHFVLKGGVLLAAFGSRRPTKDIDLAALETANDVDAVSALVTEVAATVLPDDDGIEFLPETARAKTIREDDEYQGVRVHVDARLATARLPIHVDVNVGDPIWPAPSDVAVPRLRGGEAITLRGYPIHMVYAEKIVTAVQRGLANTRWRDFGDVWSLSRNHAVNADDVIRAVGEVARHRRATLRPLADVLDGFAPLVQTRWSRWLRGSGSPHMPADIVTVLDDVVAFADPVLTGRAAGLTWDPAESIWHGPR
ncbi:nucleotidyl transferase AbiEii/AbiGii toxin family protein [Isoptericola aurantiacus]|uniref:nucleotidyl transferase AbiEii/AbiGii toxin family protein n=1 Tax=Isoptericola aurantiacus TaxID=3377839 RepID=UPI00383B122E